MKMDISTTQQVPERIKLITLWLLKHQGLVIDSKVCTIVVKIKDTHVTGEITTFPDIVS